MVSFDQSVWTVLRAISKADSCQRGKLYGIFSVKWLYIGSIVIFEAGSALCGGAPTMNAMIVGRAIAGFGVCSLRENLLDNNG